MKRFNTVTDIVNMGLITSTVITEGISTGASANGVSPLVDIALRVICLLLSLAMVITRKFFKIFTVKQEKHDAIKLLAQSKLGSVAADIISQAMQDGDISSIEFHEVKKYRKLKTDI